VKCDKETTTQTDINLGVVNIVVALLRSNRGIRHHQIQQIAADRGLRRRLWLNLVSTRNGSIPYKNFNSA